MFKITKRTCFAVSSKFLIVHRKFILPFFSFCCHTKLSILTGRCINFNLYQKSSRLHMTLARQRGREEKPQ